MTNRRLCAGLRRADRGGRVGAVGRTARQHRALEVIKDVGCRYGVRAGLLVFQGPLLHCAVNLLEVGDTGVLLGGGTGLHEVWNRDGGQQADDGHNDHDFYQGEGAVALMIHFHVQMFFQ